MLNLDLSSHVFQVKSHDDQVQVKLSSHKFYTQTRKLVTEVSLESSHVTQVPHLC